jgi:hypothetical protein
MSRLCENCGSHGGGPEDYSRPVIRRTLANISEEREHAGSTFHLNDGKFLLDYNLLHPRRQNHNDESIILTIKTDIYKAINSMAENFDALPKLTQ